MNVVFSILELLDDFSDQYDHELRDPVEVVFADVLMHVNLTVKGIEADIDQALDLKLTEKVAQGARVLARVGTESRSSLA